MNTEGDSSSITIPGGPRNSAAGSSSGRLDYPRHVAGLAIAAAIVLAAHRWLGSAGALAAAAVYGLLHSFVTAITVRQPHTMRRKLVFVAAAVLLSDASVSMSLYAGRWLALSDPIAYLVICAGAGAVAYALLLRLLLIEDLSLRAMLLIPLVSVLAVLAVYRSGLHARSIHALALAWWFTFSAGLWCEDCRRARSVGQTLNG